MDCILTDCNCSQSAARLNVKISMNLWVIWKNWEQSRLFIYTSIIIKLTGEVTKYDNVKNMSSDDQ